MWWVQCKLSSADSRRSVSQKFPIELGEFGDELKIVLFSYSTHKRLLCALAHSLARLLLLLLSLWKRAREKFVRLLAAHSLPLHNSIILPVSEPTCAELFAAPKRLQLLRTKQPAQAAGRLPTGWFVTITYRPSVCATVSQTNPSRLSDCVRDDSAFGKRPSCTTDPHLSPSIDLTRLDQSPILKAKKGTLFLSALRELHRPVRFQRRHVQKSAFSFEGTSESLGVTISSLE